MTREVRPGLWWLPECFPVNGQHRHVAVYAVAAGDSWILIDSGSVHHRDAILGDIDALTGGPGPDALVLSHTDYPHAANWRPIRERWEPVDLVASSATPSIQGLPADVRRCTVGDTLDVCGRKLQFVDPPLADRSHTTWIYDEDTGTLFTVDGFGAGHDPGQCKFTAAELPGGRVPADRVRTHHAETLVWLQYADPDAVQTAVDDVFGARDIAIVAPAHGPPLVGDAIESYRMAFRAAVEDIVAQTDPGAGDTLYGP